MNTTTLNYLLWGLDIGLLSILAATCWQWLVTGYRHRQVGRLYRTNSCAQRVPQTNLCLHHPPRIRLPRRRLSYAAWTPADTLTCQQACQKAIDLLADPDFVMGVVTNTDTYTYERNYLARNAQNPRLYLEEIGVAMRLRPVRLYQVRFRKKTVGAVATKYQHDTRRIPRICVNLRAVRKAQEDEDSFAFLVGIMLHEFAHICGHAHPEGYDDMRVFINCLTYLAAVWPQVVAKGKDQAEGRYVVTYSLQD